MPREITGEVIHVVPPEEQGDYELDGTVAELAESRYLLVCRKGGAPSFFERVVAFFKRDPIRPVTLVSDEGAEEGTEIEATVEFTTVDDVYEVIEFE
ncbi:hypothetical protein NDI56_08970 [Haloarcula sp. S1CR25-12]|uniref:Uncharacterized protein n=1 Tax=Haloarcula saliterrae TaxID=2950534 RepID=A0ABU2FB73_9EURY|nr:hypothetical protein [Haloarcula sp. S1CR25-12]MDS0259523.1 hypothetical protein [Haloarcula sp. S1CR25-12]